MTDEPVGLPLARLDRFEEKFDLILTSIEELKQRVGSLESQVANIHVDLANHSLRMDRIERRLDLGEA